MHVQKLLSLPLITSRRQQGAIQLFLVPALDASS